MNSYTPKSTTAPGVYLTLGLKILAAFFFLESLIPVAGRLCAQTGQLDSTNSRQGSILAVEGRPSQVLQNQSPDAIVIGLPTAETMRNGRLLVQPYAASLSGESSLRPSTDGSTRRETFFNADGSQVRLFSPLEYSAQAQPSTASVLDATLPAEESTPELPLAHEPILGKIINRSVRVDGPVRSIIRKVIGCPPGAGGIGRERIGNAMFQIDSASPQNMKGIQIGLDHGRQFVDRAEIYWRKTGGGGPGLAENSVNAQEARLVMENGSEKFSLTTIIPFRAVDPDLNSNHAGLGDMSTTTKTVLLDGAKLQLTQIFRSIFNTGASSSGLGTGHISLEPGLLARYKFRPQTELHYSFTYLFPIAGDPIASGQSIRWGLGGVHTTIDTDNMALLSTLELTGWNILNGTETLPSGLAVSSDGVDIINLTTGSRWVIDNGSDLGLFEFGFASTLPLTSDRWFDASFMLDFRWSQ